MTYKKSTILLFAILMISSLALTATAGHGSRERSRGGEFSFRLESNGHPLNTYRSSGYTYAEGTIGQRYAIRVFNHTAQRVEAVVTVDGRDVITGKPGNYRTNRGYVIAPYGSVLIDGFRKSLQNVAAFRFTSVPDSYAARMGNVFNVGAIGVAVFKEKHRYHRPHYPLRHKEERRDYRLGRKGKSKKSAPGSAARTGEMNSKGCYHEDVEADTQNIGTQYGETRYSSADHTTFDRQTPRHPNAKMAIYYDDRAGLIARGVIRQPRPYYNPPRYKRNPFPQNNDPGFAPPPPAYYWE